MGKLLYWSIIAGGGVLSVILSVLSGFNLIYLFAFLFGYSYSKRYRTLEDNYIDKYEVFVVILGYVLIWGRIVVEFVFNRYIPGYLGDATELCVSYSLIVSLKMLLHHVYKIKNESVLKLILLLDGISYEVYLIHHVFILGVLSVMRVTECFLLNVALALCLTIASAIVLHLLSLIAIKTITIRKSI